MNQPPPAIAELLSRIEKTQEEIRVTTQKILITENEMRRYLSNGNPKEKRNS